MKDENDIVALDIELEPIRGKLAPLTDAIRELVVDSQLAAGQMADLLKLVKAQINKAEDARKRLVKPLNDHVKWINGEVKTFTTPLLEADAIGRDKLRDFERARMERERAQREATERLHRERMEKLAEAQRAAGAAEEAEKTLAAPPPPSAKAETTRGAAGMATASAVWKYEIVDQDAVPREYMTVNTLGVCLAIRAGTRSIPGIRIYEDVQIGIR